MQPLSQLAAENSTASLLTIFFPVDEVTIAQIFIGACALSLNFFVLMVLLSQCNKTPLSMTEKLIFNQLVLDGLVGLSVVTLRALRYGNAFKNSPIERLLCTVKCFVVLATILLIIFVYNCAW